MQKENGQIHTTREKAKESGVCLCRRLVSSRVMLPNNLGYDLEEIRRLLDVVAC